MTEPPDARSGSPADSDEPPLHAWHIEEREYRRQEERRGRRHAFERIQPTRTALVVVDMVPFFVTELAYCRGIVPNIGRLASALRSAGGTVAWVLPSPSGRTALDDEFFGPQAAEAYRRSGGDGPLRTRLWHEFDVHDADVLVEKSASSAFFPGRCPLHELLAARGIDTVVITGTVTNVCCESSARDASTLGYRVVFVADGNAARRDQDHNATLYTVYRTFGDVRTTIEVIGLIDAARQRSAQEPASADIAGRTPADTSSGVARSGRPECRSDR